MTQRRNFDRVARAWLDLMPSEAPDRVAEAVLDAVERTPQVRRPIGVPIRRTFLMNRSSMATIVVATVVVLAGGTVALNWVTGPRVGGPAPTASEPSSSATPSPTASPSGAAVPDSLVGSWFGASGSFQGLSAGAGTVLKLGSREGHLFQSNHQDAPWLSSDASIAGGQLRFVATSAPPFRTCQTGQVGTYAYSLSASGQTLTISDGQDDCGGRLQAMSGTWWRIDCRNGQTTCLGEMDPGTYASQYVRPIRAGAPWAPLFGGLTFSVPQGWANDADWPASFGLSLAADFEKTSAASPDPSPRLLMLTQVAAASQAKPCAGVVDPGVARTSAAIIAWLRTIPGLAVGPAVPVTVGNLTGTSVDLSIVAGKAPTCDGDPIVEYLIASSGDANAEGYGIGASEAQRVIFVDVAPDEVLAIRLEAVSTSQLASFAEAAMPVIASFEFK